MLVTPGANVLLVSHLALAGERRAAASAAVGVALGALLWSSAAMLGVHALFLRYPALRLLLQLAGAVYLLYLGSRLWRAATPAGKTLQATSALRALAAGLLTNPKAALFFVGVFSAALPAHPEVALMLAVEALVLANALAWHLLLAFLLSRPGLRSRLGNHARLLGRTSGALVSVLGALLLLAAILDEGT